MIRARLTGEGGKEMRKEGEKEREMERNENFQFQARLVYQRLRKKSQISSSVTRSSLLLRGMDWSRFNSCNNSSNVWKKSTTGGGGGKER